MGFLGAVRDDVSLPSGIEVRGVREIRAVAATLSVAADPLLVCKEIVDNRFRNDTIRAFFEGLPEEHRHYWIASLYALLMGSDRRKQLAAYFTPPHLVDYCIDVLSQHGVQVGKDRILDPSSGGAAFLVPLAQRIVRDGRRSGMPDNHILESITTSLFGIEIDAGLSNLSRTLMERVLDAAGIACDPTSFAIVNADTLDTRAPDQLFDAVIGNPPYGRVRRPEVYLERFRDVVSASYFNLYALFIEAALRWTKPGGLICLVVPTSFIGGPYFEKLRASMTRNAYVVQLDPVNQREDLFLDVLYDVCVLVLRKKGQAVSRPVPSSHLLHVDRPPEPLGVPDIPTDDGSSRIWAMPSGASIPYFQPGLARLQDYGYRAKVGYFVWNREKERYATRPKGPQEGEVPLYWAHGVKANEEAQPNDRKNSSGDIGVVSFPGSSPAVIQSDAIILQRTTNKRQNRRLVAGLIYSDRVPGNAGFVSENHTILVLPIDGKEQRVTLETLCRLLNTSAVDERFRRISGTVSVSSKALAVLPLPRVEEITALFGACDDEVAARMAYERSLAKAASPRLVEVP